MTYPTDLLYLAKAIDSDLRSIGVTRAKIAELQPGSLTYDELILEPQLRKKTEKLFKDGHHARAVEEAFKLLDNLVKKRAGLEGSVVSGASMMQNVFSVNEPILRLNAGLNKSENDEQQGYMQIFTGCMTGIRNPRAHDSDWEDPQKRALQLLILAEHLIERTMLAKKQSCKSSNNHFS